MHENPAAGDELKRHGDSASKSEDWADLARELLKSPLGIQTPFLMLDLDRVTKSYELLAESLSAAQIFYAVKANSNPTLLRHLAELGAGFDAASAGELYLLSKVANVPGDRILFTHPTKDPDAIMMIAKVRPKAIVIDSLSRLEDLVRSGIPGNGYHPALLVRIQAVSSNLNKFGQAMFIADPDAPHDVNRIRVRSGEVCDIFRTAARQGGFSKLGVTFHVGTQCVDPLRYKRMLGVIRHTIIDPLAAEGIHLGIVDIGGGFSDARTADEKQVSQATMLGRLNSYLLDPKYVPAGTEVFAEPGRFLVADSGTIVTEFVARAEFKGYELTPEMQQELGLQGNADRLSSTVLRLEINDSLYNNLLPQIHDEREWEVMPFLKEPTDGELSAEKSQCIIFGHTCDAFDRLRRRDGYWLPKNTSEGTLGLLFCAGAYTRETAANFNGFAKSDLITFRRMGAEIRCRVDRAERPWRLAPEVSQDCWTLDTACVGKSALSQIG